MKSVVTYGMSGLLGEAVDDRAGGGTVLFPLGQSKGRVIPLHRPPVHALQERTLPHVQTVVRRQSWGDEGEHVSAGGGGTCVSPRDEVSKTYNSIEKTL